MKLTASLSASAALVLSTAASYAGTIAPGIDLNLSSGTTNYSFVQSAPGTFVAADGASSVTVLYANSPGLLDTFTISEICVNVGPFVPCKGYTLAITDAQAAGVSLGLGLSIAAQADTKLTTNLATIKVDGSLGAALETINFALPSSTGSVPTTSPVPEPGSLCLMATGLVGAAGTIRRKLSV